MKLIQKLAECTTNIVKHPLEVMLVVGMGISVMGCKSLENVVDNPKKEIIALENSIEQDLEQLSGNYSPRYNTITHRLLEMEVDVGADSEDYRFLDKLIEEAKLKIDIKENYNEAETIDTLQIISEMLKPFQKEPKRRRSSLLNKCFEEKLLDCDSLSLVYLAIGEVINLPMKLAIIPHHAFIRVYTENGFIDWDSSNLEYDKIIPEGKYVKEENIDNWPKILDTKNVFGLHHFNRSSEWLDKYLYSKWQEDNGMDVDEIEKLSYLKEGLNDVNKAITLFPESFSVYYNKGTILFYMEDYNKSLEAFTKANTLWKNEAEVLVWQGKIYYQLSKYDTALELLDLAVEINPYLEEAYSVRSEIWERKGNRREALDDLKMALELYISTME